MYDNPDDPGTGTSSSAFGTSFQQCLRGFNQGCGRGMSFTPLAICRGYICSSSPLQDRELGMRHPPWVASIHSVFRRLQIRLFNRGEQSAIVLITLPSLVQQSDGADYTDDHQNHEQSLHLSFHGNRFLMALL
jgi:hypothetical protein